MSILTTLLHTKGIVVKNQSTPELADGVVNCQMRKEPIATATSVQFEILTPVAQQNTTTTTQLLFVEQWTQTFARFTKTTGSGSFFPVPACQSASKAWAHRFPKHGQANVKSISRSYVMLSKVLAMLSDLRL